MAAIEKSTEEGTEVVERPKSFEGWVVDRRAVACKVSSEQGDKLRKELAEDIDEDDLIDEDGVLPLDQLFQYR